MQEIMSPIVSIDWLLENMNDPDLLIFDATIKKVTGSTSGESSNLGIAGAQFFDIKKSFSDQASSLPNMLPSAKEFTKAAQKMGISSNSKIVFYDKLGVYSSPRAWWMFRAMRHQQVAVLDGGFPEWIRAGGAINELALQFEKTGDFEAVLQEDWVVNASDVLINIESKNSLVLDARSAGRFNGTEPEPRAGLRGGHIPGSFSLPFKEVLEDGKFKSIPELKAIFSKHKQLGKKMVFSCGSGITASIIMLAANLAGVEGGAVYDGSWTEWGDKDLYPVEK